MKVSVLPVLLFCLVGCNKGSIDTKEAVRQGVIDYLASRQNLNVASMSLEVTSVTFKENEADATVAFSAKGGGGQPVSFNYTLERKGNRWVVKPGTAGKSGHGGGDMSPSVNPHGGMPPAGGAMPGDAMPPGHPAVPQK